MKNEFVAELSLRALDTKCQGRSNPVFEIASSPTAPPLDHVIDLGNRHKNKGFTIAEVLISAAIIILVLTGMLSLYLLAHTLWIKSNTRITLQRDARTTMEKMVRGISGTDGIREAASVGLPNSYTINYISGIDGIERSFYLSNGEIWHDPDTSIANNEFSIAKNVQTFNIAAGNTVSIDLAMQDTVSGKAINVFLYTQIKLRN